MGDCSGYGFVAASGDSRLFDFPSWRGKRREKPSASPSLTPLLLIGSILPEFGLPVIEGVQILILHEEGEIVFRQGFFLEELGKSVMLRCKACPLIEIPFVREN